MGVQATASRASAPSPPLTFGSRGASPNRPLPRCLMAARRSSGDFWGCVTAAAPPSTEQMHRSQDGRPSPRRGRAAAQPLHLEPLSPSIGGVCRDRGEQGSSFAVVDLSRLMGGGEALQAVTPSCSEVQRIAEAARCQGFFQVVGHGIDPELMERMVSLQQWFFALPTETKRTIKRSASNSRGWFDDEYTKQKLDWKQCLDIGVEGRSDDIDGTNQWLGFPNSSPSDPPEYAEFREVMLRYFDAMTDLAHVLTRLLAIGLGMPADYWDSDFEDHTSFIRLNSYPKCSDPSQHLGISPHKDAGFLTVLAQHDIAGLQVYLGEGDGLDREGPGWETVEPLPGAFVINVGDMFEVASNGLYRAPLHRVLANKENPRCSAPFFYNPSHLCTFEPVSGCVSKESPPMYGPVNWGEFRRRRIQGDLADVGKEIQISDFLLQRP